MSRENTLTTALVQEGATIKLPLPVHSYYVEDSIRAITKDGKEIPIDIDLDSFGLGKVRVPKGAERITYTIQESILREIPSDLDELEFEKLKKNILEQETGIDYLKKVSGINEQDMLFIKSIESKTPREKIIAIEQYVREIGFYDINNNDEVVGPKRNADSEELLYLMEERMNELKSGMGPLSDKIYNKKRYAGVCDDFSKLTTILLRQAGIPSGLMTCFNAGSGKDISITQAHAASFVLWRGPAGNITPYVIDGTPQGITQEERAMQEELGITLQTMQEKEKEHEQVLKEIHKGTEQEIQKIKALLQDATPESLEKLDTGTLQHALNVILTNDVHWGHVQSLEAILDVYRYTPIHKEIDTTDQSVVKKFIEEQMTQTKTKGEYAAEHSGSAGTALLKLAQEFTEKEEKRSREGVQDFKKITEILKTSLTDSEYRALSLIAQYLEVKKKAKNA